MGVREPVFSFLFFLKDIKASVFREEEAVGCVLNVSNQSLPRNGEL